MLGVKIFQSTFSFFGDNDPYSNHMDTLEIALSKNVLICNFQISRYLRRHRQSRCRCKPL